MRGSFTSRGYRATLRHGARVNEVVADGAQPLLNELVRWGQVRQALRLLGQGGDPNRADARGWTALHPAASRGNERLLQAILMAGGDRHRKDIVGLTAMDVARVKGRGKLVTLLEAD